MVKPFWGPGSAWPGSPSWCITRTMCSASWRYAFEAFESGWLATSTSGAAPAARGAAVGISAVTGRPNASSARSRVWIRRLNRLEIRVTTTPVR